jgi:hypothetical protein
MSEPEFYHSLTKPAVLSFDRFAIKDAPEPGDALVAAPSGRGKGFIRRNVNERLNGRLSTRLPLGSEWHVHWKTPLPGNSFPASLLQLDGRLVLQGGSSVYLFNGGDGSSLEAYDLGPSDVAVDPLSHTFYFADPMGYVQACRLDGRVEHVCPVRFNQEFSHVLLWRYPDGYLIFSRSVSPPAVTFPKVWAVERVELGDPARTDEDRLLAGARSAGTLLQRKSKLLPPPMDGRWFWLATYDRVYALGQDLGVVRALDGEFDPLAISLDESGRIYLVVRDGERAALWILNQKGERSLRVTLPDAVSRPVAPPLIDGHHRSVILGEASLAVVDHTGAVRWQRDFEGLDGARLRASLTGNDQLLVAGGPRVAAFDREGLQTVIYERANEQFLTAPILDERGRLFIASQTALYCLVPGPTKP